jgi:beta-glucanase (GH16 family)
MVWHDEFDGSSIDTTKWNHELLDPYTYNSELQQYTDSADNSRIDDGQLVITALGEVSSSWTGYTSARLNTDGKASWTYGRIEGALMVPDGVGTWPALWMLPTDWSYGDWPYSGEIDIMEHVGCDANEVVGTVHTGAYNHMLGTQRGGDVMLPTATSSMHVYAVDWTPDQIHFALDGLRYFTFENDGAGNSDTWPFDQRFHLIVNLAVGGSWGGYCGVDASAFPEEYRLDWIRVYQTDAEASGTP